MGFLDKILGRDTDGRADPTAYGSPRAQGSEPPVAPGATADDRAIARYRYLLRTASPEQLEEVHAEAFAQLTPEQRSRLLQELSTSLPPGEQVRSDEPRDLARAATRAEMRRPGYLQDTLGRASFGGGVGMGGTIMGSMLGTIGGVIVGSAIADALFDGYGDSPEATESGDTAADLQGDGSGDGGTGDGGIGDSGADTGSGGGWDSTGDTGNTGDTGGDWGGDTGGSDFGGGDFGGGDFGGGDFGGGF